LCVILLFWRGLFGFQKLKHSTSKTLLKIKIGK
jgi:hypothetical protein